MSAQTPPPLTTIYTPPSSCNSILTYDGETIWRGQLSSVGDSDCYPPNFSRAWWYYYSPGVCPSGWYSASSATGAHALVTNTAEFNAICCPKNWFVGTGPVPSSDGLFCASILSGTVTNVYSTATRTQGPIPENPSLVTLNAKSLQNPTAWADIVQVRWQETDTQIVAMMAAEASASTSSQVPTVAQATVISSAGNESKSSMLSTGAKAGIGVVIAMVVLGIIGGLLIVWRKKKRQNNKSLPMAYAHTDNTPVLYNNVQTQELDGQFNERSWKGELDGRPIKIAERQTGPAELST